MEMAVLGLVLCLAYGYLDSLARRSQERLVRRYWAARHAEWRAEHGLEAVGTS